MFYFGLILSNFEERDHIIGHEAVIRFVCVVVGKVCVDVIRG